MPFDGLESQTEKKRRGGSQNGVSIYVSLLPVCGFDMTGCPTYLLSQLVLFSP